MAEECPSTSGVTLQLRDANATRATLKSSQVNKFHVVCNLEEHLWRISGKTTDSADAEKDFRESKVRISDCLASSILKAVPVSEDSKENALCKHEKFMH